MSQELVPIVALIVLGGCILIPFYLRHLTGVKKLETLVKLAENGTNVNADTLSLLSRETGPVNDFRRGVIFIAISIPVIISLLISERYDLAILLGGIPLCVGAAFLMINRYGHHTNANEA